MGKTGKEIEELTGGDRIASAKYGRRISERAKAPYRPRSGRGGETRKNMLLIPEEQAEIWESIIEKTPEEFGLPDSLWTLKKVCAFVWKRYRKKMSGGCASDYMRRWGLSCQRPVKRAGRQDSFRV